MKRSKMLAVVLACLMLVALVAGCNKEETTTTTAAPTTTNTNATSGASNTTINMAASTTTERTQTTTAEGEVRLYGGTLVVRNTSDPATLNPVMQADDYGSPINQNVYNKIITMDNEWEINPDLAHSWEISEDSLTYTFHFHDNIYWHDGTKFTARDAEWTLEAIIKYEGYLKQHFTTVEDIYCPDDNTLVIQLNAVSAPLLGYLAWYGNQIIAQHIYDEGENTDWWSNPANQHPIGTGPFKFVEWISGVSIELEANEDYFLGRPYVDRLIFVMVPDSSTAWQSFMNGEIDITSPPAAEIPNVLANPELTTFQYASPSCYYMGFNHGRELLQDINVRKAIAMCVDRPSIVSRAFNGFAFEGWTYYTPVIAWASNPNANPPALDIEGAAELLETNGYKVGADGYRISVVLEHFQNQNVSDMVAVMKEDMAKAGINLIQSSSELQAWTKKVQKDYDFDLSITNGAQGPDPNQIMNRYYSKGTSSIFGPISIPEIDAWCEAGKGVADLEKRGEIYFEMQQYLADNVISVPLTNIMSTVTWRNTLDGHPNSPEGRAVGVSFANYSLTRFNDPDLIY